MPKILTALTRILLLAALAALVVCVPAQAAKKAAPTVKFASVPQDTWAHWQQISWWLYTGGVSAASQKATCKLDQRAAWTCYDNALLDNLEPGSHVFSVTAGKHTVRLSFTTTTVGVIVDGVPSPS
jgi:hypothetical protein